MTKLTRSKSQKIINKKNAINEITPNNQKENVKDISTNNKNEINKLKDKIIGLEKRIKELENILNEKDNIIQKLKNEKIEYNNLNEKLNELNKMNSESKEQISKKEKIIKEYELKISQFPFDILPGEKIMSIIFISFDQNVITSFICKNTDIFNALENKFYEKYSEYKSLDNIFTLNGRKIKKNKSLDENKIKNNDIITIFK